MMLPMRLPATWMWLLCALLVSCGTGGDRPDGGPGTDGDGVSGDAGDPGPADLDPTPLPLNQDDVVRIGQPGGIDLASAALVDSDGDLVVVVEHYDAEFTTGRLLEYRSAGGVAWTGPTDIDLGAATYTGSPSIVGHAGTTWLYFAQADGLYSALSLHRSAWGQGSWQVPENMEPVAGATSLLSWPVFAPLEDGRVGLAFRDGQSLPQVALSDDGTFFSEPTQVMPTGAAMVALGDMADGTLACTYQTGSGGSMTAWVRTSPDGQQWSDPIQVSDASTNVHDTCPVRRLDGDLDLYYIWPCSPAGFCLFRRALSADGQLGPEQQVTAAEVGETTKPAALRLPDGSLLILWAEITQRGPGGEPTEQILSGAELAGDAPR